MVESVPPYEDDNALDPVGFWFRPYVAKADDRRKLMRKQIFASLVSILHDVVKHRPVIIVGAEQGGLMSLIFARPLVLEAACRARIVTSRELLEIRKAWTGVVAVIGVNPLVLPQRTQFAEFVDAVPEFVLAQPQGIMRLPMIKPGTVRSMHKVFVQALSEALGTTALPFNGFAEAYPGMALFS